MALRQSSRLTSFAGPLMTSASSASCMKIQGSVNFGSRIVSPGPTTASGFFMNMLRGRGSRCACSQ
jgi:hypothetical protein